MYRQLCPPGTDSYVIKAGDALYQIAERFNTTVAALMLVNPGINPNMLQIGQKICVPRQPIFHACPDGEYYTIKAGDTLYGIARVHEISLNDLIEANPGLNPYMLMVGNVLCIPSTTPTVDCEDGSPYKVVAGDSFYKIAQAKDVSLDALLAANPDLNPDRMEIGQTICIPYEDEEMPEECPRNSEPYIIKAGDTFYGIASRLNTTVRKLRRLNPNVNPNSLRVGQKICVPKSELPKTKEIPVTIGGVTENLKATLKRSPQDYYIYVLDNYKFTPEEPGKDQLYSTIDDSFFVRIEKLPDDVDIDDLKANALTELRDIATPIEISGRNIAIPFFRDSKFFLYATNAEVTKNIVVMEIDGALFRFNMHFPSVEDTGEIVPGFYAMLQTIGVQ